MCAGARDRDWRRVLARLGHRAGGGGSYSMAQRRHRSAILRCNDVTLGLRRPYASPMMLNCCVHALVSTLSVYPLHGSAVVEGVKRSGTPAGCQPQWRSVLSRAAVVASPLLAFVLATGSPTRGVLCAAHFKSITTHVQRANQSGRGSDRRNRVEHVLRHRRWRERTRRDAPQKQCAIAHDIAPAVTTHARTSPHSSHASPHPVSSQRAPCIHPPTAHDTASRPIQSYPVHSRYVPPPPTTTSLYSRRNWPCM